MLTIILAETRAFLSRVAKRILHLTYPGLFFVGSVAQQNINTTNTLKQLETAVNSVLDVTQFRQLVRWLENNKIRHYQPKERQALESVKDNIKWKAAYEEYLRQLVRFDV